jgi:hypothetical protein
MAFWVSATEESQNHATAMSWLAFASSFKARTNYLSHVFAGQAVGIKQVDDRIRS